VENLLEIKNLSVNFEMPDRTVMAVRNLSFSLANGEALGLVGESGCGKSVTAFSILRLLPKQGKIVSGEILYRGKDIVSMADEDLRKIRGKEIAIIFQEPMTSLNPVFTVGYQICESLKLHLGMTNKEAREYAADLLDQVGIASPSKRIDSYPHEFSGGMRQRAMIAMALSASPSLLIADEPTTALDVTIQSQILDLLLKLQEEKKMSLLLITHDLGVVSNVVDRVAIMYAGEISEIGTTAEIFNSPMYPYTVGLFNSIPKIGKVIGKAKNKLSTIPGSVPTVVETPTGCIFYPRCEKHTQECFTSKIDLVEQKEMHFVRCINI
jgi:oligopeptide/dipeptide ABC transporter ATP-binding protein